MESKGEEEAIQRTFGLGRNKYGYGYACARSGDGKKGYSRAVFPEGDAIRPMC